MDKIDLTLFNLKYLLLGNYVSVFKWISYFIDNMLLLNNTMQARLYLQKRAFFISFFTVAVLFIFQPFGTYESQDPFKYLKLTGYGLATFFAIIVSGLIELQLTRLKSQYKFYPVCILVMNLIIAAVFNHSYFVVTILEQWHWANQLMFVIYVSAIATFPLSIMYIQEQSRLDNKQKATHVKTPPLTNEQANTRTTRFTLYGDNKTEQLTLTIEELVYLKAADNYCDIYTYKNETLHTTVLRIPLSRAIEQIPSNKGIIKCHRSYAVNLSFVKSSSGNANGLQLTLNVTEDNIPVSRTFVDAIKQSLLATTDS
ncbi:LytTR family transcriptional regulator [Psychrosphaera sp.]|nr:LytTR family transcriptional regulator [Psychrosphaera sp.]